MKTKAIQLFTDEYLKQCKKMTPTQIAQFLDDFRKSQSPYSEKSIPISIKIPENLLNTFKLISSKDGKKYQTKIKELMEEYIFKKHL